MIALQRGLTGRGQPDQRPAQAGLVAFALQQALALQVADDLADHGLGAARVADAAIPTGFARTSSHPLLGWSS